MHYIKRAERGWYFKENKPKFHISMCKCAEQSFFGTSAKLLLLFVLRLKQCSHINRVMLNSPQTNN